MDAILKGTEEVASLQPGPFLGSKCKHTVFSAPIGKTLTLMLGAIISSGAASDDAQKLMEKVKFMRTPDAKIALANQAIELDPKCGDAYAYKGYWEYLNKDYNGTIRDCSTAISLPLKDRYYRFTAFNYRYHAYIELKDYKRALPAVSNASISRNRPGQLTMLRF
jgi:tetratricopeptide (TPR) repeat protein